jgi:hypothetical protein
MTGHDADWLTWTERWQDLDAAPPPASLAARVGARGRLMAVWAAGEVAIGATAVVVLITLAATASSSADRLAMLALAAVSLAAGGFAWWNWRGTWRPRSQSLGSFVELSRLRCRRVRRGIAAGWWILAAEIACFVPWLALRPTAPGTARVGGYLLLAGLALAAVVALIAVKSWARREEEAIDTLAAEAGDC